MAISADGYITRHEDGLVNWTSKEDKKLFVKLTKEAGVLIYGRKTFSFHNKPLPDRLNIVMTRDPKKYENIPGQLEFTNLPPREILLDLQRQGYKKVFVAGGPEINELFIKDGLVSELYLTIEPLLFGSGKRLMPDTNLEVPLELVEILRLTTNSIVLHYKVKK